MSISVVISAYNEEKNIEQCLKSIKEIADEVVVVDNSSTDNTAKIAKRYTDKVYVRENDPLNIDYQKNFGFEKATKDFILSLDADEMLTKELVEEIKKLKWDVDGYWIPRKNYIFGRWIKSEMWWPDYQLRLFRKGRGSYDKKVHTSLNVEGETAKLEHPFIHNNYTSVSQYITKLNNYTDIEAKILLDSGYSFKWIDAIRFPSDDFFKTFFLQKGYKEGLHGLVLSLLQAFYMEVVFAKLWETRKFEEVDGGGFLNDLKKEAADVAYKFRYWALSIKLDDSTNLFNKAAIKTIRKVLSKKIKSK